MVSRWQIVSEKAVSIPSRYIGNPENRFEPLLTVSSLGLPDVAKEWETIECPALLLEIISPCSEMFCSMEIEMDIREIVTV